MSVGLLKQDSRNLFGWLCRQGLFLRLGFLLKLHHYRLRSYVRFRKRRCRFRSGVFFYENIFHRLFHKYLFDGFPFEISSGYRLLDRANLRNNYFCRSFSHCFLFRKEIADFCRFTEENLGFFYYLRLRTQIIFVHLVYFRQIQGFRFGIYHGRHNRLGYFFPLRRFLVFLKYLL